MASISSLGVGSNLDLNSLLSNLQSAENAPLKAIQDQQVSYTAKLTAYGTLRGALSTLQAAAAKLADPTLFQGITTSSSATSVLTATAGATAIAGSYSVNVAHLAQAQSLAAAGVADATTAIGNGTVTIDFGKMSGGVFAASGSSSSITIDNTNHTLTGIRDEINKNTALGVTATIVNDGSGTPYRLTLTSKATGESSMMRIAVVGDVALSNLLSQDPDGVQNLTQTAAAQDAALTVNGISVASASNTVKEAIQGVTMTLVAAGTSTVSVALNTSAMTSAINDFGNAFNNLHSVASQLTAYDTDKKTGAALVGDSTLRNIQTRIRSLLNTPQSSGTLTTLSQIGVSFTKDGTLSVDPTKFNTAFSSDIAGVAKLFSGTNGVGGYGRQISSLVSGFTDTDGALTAATNGINTTLKTLDTEYSRTSDHIDATMARYKAQFTQLDTLIAGMNQTTSYLTQQFDAMNSATRK